MYYRHDLNYEYPEKSDQHMLPFGRGNIDFEAVVAALREIGFDGTLSLESNVIPGRERELYEAARRLAGSFKAMTITAAAVSVVCFLMGLCASFVWSLPTGASVVGVNLIVLLVSRLIPAKN